MFQQRVVRTAVRMGVLGVIAMSLTVIQPEASFAFCGGKCQNAKRCGELVKEKGVKGSDAQHAEYNKCMSDTANYK